MARRGGRRRRGAHGEHENEDRWLLTYADMITLLMALFMVLFSMSSVNTSKYESLQKALQDAFSGKVLSGGKAIRQEGSTEEPKHASPQMPVAAIAAMTGQPTKQDPKQARQEDEDFRMLKARIDRWTREHGLQDEVSTTIARRGLVIRLLTDRVLFDSGEADLKPASGPLLRKMAQLLQIDVTHPIAVEGHTDPLPIRSERFPSNWELSTARASSVVRFLIARGLRSRRLFAAGYASLHPLTTNSTADGRSRNRRVEIVLLRLRSGAQGGAP
jgi:chemotaxis protein MotB